MYGTCVVEIAVQFIMRQPVELQVMMHAFIHYTLIQ